MKKDILGVFIVIVLLAIVGAFFFLLPTAGPAFGPVELSGGSITVTDQESIDEIYLAVELVEPGFVSVHESMGDAPTEVVAVSELLPAGYYDNLLITPDSTLTPGAKYITILHVDDGDGVFGLQDDKPVSVNGAVVRPSFKAGVTQTE